MKKYLILAIAALAITACNQQELADAKQEKDSLLMIVNERDASLNEFMAAFNEVERNLDSVAARQNIISTSAGRSGELNQGQKARINAQVEAINQLMDENRKKLAELTQKLKSSGRKNAGLEKTIATMSSRLAQKDQELTALNETLNSLHAQVILLQTSVNDLTVENQAKSATIAEETAALHTAYYVVGQSKALLEANLIDRKGGLLGMGKTSKISSDIDNNKFTRIDYTQTTSISIEGKDVKIITAHPADSYSLDKDGNDKNLVRNLVISNPEKFWSASKYLVVVKD